MNALNSKLKMQNVKWLAVVAFLILHFTFYIPSASAQRACTMENEAAICGALGPQFRCVSNRCNLPPPIWNVAGTGLATTGQVGSFYVRQSSVVGDRLGVGTAVPSEKLELRDDTVGVTRLRITETGDGQNPEIQLKYGTGDSEHWALYVDRASGDLRIWRGENRLQLQADGTLRLPTGNIELGRAGATVDGLNLDTALTGITVNGGGLNVSQNGRNVALSLLSSCEGGQVLKWSGTAWGCADDVVGAAGGGGGGGSGGLTGSGAVGQLAFWTGASTLGTTGSVPWSRLTGFPQGCAPAQFVRAIGTDGLLVCATPPAGGGGGGLVSEADPIYGAWYNGGSPTVSGTLTVSNNIRATGSGGFGGYAPDATWRISTPSIYIGDGVRGTIIGAGAGQRAGDITTDGNVNARGCLGPVVVGATVGAVNGAQGGYRGIDALCNAAGAFPGSHQCSTSEVLMSIHCGAIWTDATKNTLQPIVAGLIGINAWIANGAPSLPTPTNDCYGWMQTGVIGGQQSQGIAWNFNVAGGAGYARPCNEQNRVLCCR